MELIETYPIATVCQVVDYPRSQVYYRPQAVEDESDRNGAILTLAGQHPTYGYRRITAMLKRQGQTVNHKRAAILSMRTVLIFGSSMRPERPFPSFEG